MYRSKQLKAQMAEKWAEVEKLQAKVLEEDRAHTQEEKDFIEKALDEFKKIEDAIAEEQKSEALNAGIDKYADMFKAAPDKQDQKTSPKQRQQAPQQRKTYGQQFIESEEWQGFVKRFAPNGRLSNLKGFTSDPVEIKGLLDGFGKKELVTGVADTSAGAWIIPDQSGIYEQIGRYPLNLRSLIDVRTTGSDTVEWVQQTLQVTQATPVAEANVTTYTGATGEVSGEKPEGTTRWERMSTTVKTIPVWIPATTRALADAPQLRGLIDSELRNDVDEELENQLFNGSGVGENLMGLNNVVGVLTQAFTTDIAVTARMAITNLLINGRQMPTAFMFNPEDWEAYDLLQDNEGRYYWGGPMAQGPRTLWGVPVAQSFFQGAGTGWLGNWRKMVLWDREQATIAVSDSHEDFFIRNMVAIRCELRAAMGVIRPTAFVEIDMTSGS
jgi:HK97 family phage major capsid protein